MPINIPVKKRSCFISSSNILNHCIVFMTKRQAPPLFPHFALKRVQNGEMLLESISYTLYTDFMATLPNGTVTFLFTDIQGSTKLAQEHPDHWESMRARHDAILRSAIEANNGHAFQIVGDSFCAAFHTPMDAFHSAIQSQLDLHHEDWGDAMVKVRMGIHTGKAELQDSGQYHAYLTLSRAQRLMSAGHGGQVLVSLATQELIRDELPEGITLRDLGERRLRDMSHPEHVFQLDIENLPVDFPPIKSIDVALHNIPAQMTSFIGREKELAE